MTASSQVLMLAVTVIRKEEGLRMKAAVGDRLVIRGHRVGEHKRIAVILEIRGDDGGPPFLVKWLDDEREGLVFPGPDAMVEHVD